MMMMMMMMMMMTRATVVSSPAHSCFGWHFHRPDLSDPFASVSLQDLHHYYESARPRAPHWYSPPCGVRHLEFSLLVTNRMQISALGIGCRYRDDRFSCSLPTPTTSSRHLYTGCHQGHTQAAPWLGEYLCSTPLSRGMLPTSVSTSLYSLSMRQQWFTHVRLLVAYLTRYDGPFASTLTTLALY
jgi:hypothetical protein